MTQPDHSQALTHHWMIGPAGRLELTPGPATGGAVRGTITPIAASGWIDLPESGSRSLESGIADALTLTQILDRLEDRFPGYRWYIRDARSAA